MADLGDNLQAPELDQPVLELQAGQEAATTRQQQATTGGGLVTSITSGGTGSSTAAGALANLGAAPSNATFVTQTPSAGLSAEQALSLLTTGFMFVTTVTGVITSRSVAQVLSDLGLSKNHVGVVAPTVNDDNTLGYSINSIWCNTTGPTTYVCQNAGTGAAVWHAIP